MRSTRLIPGLVLAAAVLVLAAPAFADQTFDCTPSEVLELGNRIHVKCSTPATVVPSSGSVDYRARASREIRYLAIGKTDRDKANRFTSLATAAMVSGKKFRVVIGFSSSTNTDGCNPNDCRTPSAFGIVN